MERAQLPDEPVERAQLPDEPVERAQLPEEPGLPPVEEVRPGLWSLPVPIPDSPLRYVLAYGFEVPSGVVLVDPGWNAPEPLEALEAGLDRLGTGLAGVRGVLVTHIHPDHYGLAGRVRELSGAWVALHPADAALVNDRYEQVDRLLDRTADWLRATGAPEGEVEALRGASMQIRRFVVSAHPDVLLEHGDRPDVPGWRLVAVHTPGHTPGHLCFHEEGTGVLLTGDHVLPGSAPTCRPTRCPPTTRSATTSSPSSRCRRTPGRPCPATSGASTTCPAGSTSCSPTTRSAWTRRRLRWRPGPRPCGRSRAACAGRGRGGRSPGPCAGPRWARPMPT